jgi:hypothetical protein
MDEYFYVSASFVNQTAYDKILSIFRKTIDQPEGPTIEERDFYPEIEDTLPDWIRKNTFPLSLQFNGEEVGIDQGLYFLDQKNTLVEISTRTKHLDMKVQRMLFDLEIPVEGSYVRIARARIQGRIRHEIYKEDLKNVFAPCHMYSQENVPEDIMDMFMLENLIRRHG